MLLLFLEFNTFTNYTQVFFNRKPRFDLANTPLKNPTLSDIEDLELEYSSDDEELDGSGSESDDETLEAQLVELGLSTPDTPLSPRNTETSGRSQRNPTPTPSSASDQEFEEPQLQQIELTESEELVQQAHARARARIEAKYNKAHAIRVFKPGDLATFSLARPTVPSSTSLPRIPCRILEVIGDCYRIQTQWGILDHLQATEVLIPLASTTNLATIVPPPIEAPYLKSQMVTLNRLIETVRLETSGCNTLRLYCNCRSRSNGKRCITRLCRCRKAGVSCTNYCHGEQGHPLAKQSDCLNLAPSGRRGEAVIINPMDGNSMVGDEARVDSVDEPLLVENQLLQEQQSRGKRRSQSLSRGNSTSQRVRFNSPLTSAVVMAVSTPRQRVTRGSTRVLGGNRTTIRHAACHSCKQRKVKCKH